MATSKKAAPGTVPKPLPTPTEKKLAKDLRAKTTVLSDLTDKVMVFLSQFDILMKQPESPERGRRLASLANWLELNNDSIRYSTLGVDYHNGADDKRARVAMLIKKFNPQGEVPSTLIQGAGRAKKAKPSKSAPET